MDNYRLILSITLMMLGMMIWLEWESKSQYPMLNQNNIKDIRPSNTEETLETATLPNSIKTKSSTETTGNSESKHIVVATDVLRVHIDSEGGTIVKVELLAYPISDSDKTTPFKLLSDDPSELFNIQSGVISVNKQYLPSHKVKYATENNDYSLAKGQKDLVVALHWQSENGVKVNKSYIFHQGSYVIDLKHEVINDSEEILPVREYRQLIRKKPIESKESAFLYTYLGGAIYSPDNKFHKLDFDELKKSNFNEEITNGWLSMLQHHFLAAIIPNEGIPNSYYSKALSDGLIILGCYGPTNKIAPGEKSTFLGRLWIGPKLQVQLENTTAGLELVTDYGWLTIIAKPLFLLLKYLNDLTGNWGWAIVLLTILIKLAFYRLSAASYKSMANMRKLTPKLQSIKERFGEDKEKYNKAMMEMYQKEKINPLGGCLPIVVQIPVFIALYWVVLESVELRDAPFILWIDNLSAMDPYFVLPLIMGISMFVQQKLNPPPPDPMQAKIMMSLPFIFTAFFAFFPAGLVLYWVVNNLLSIAQQWRITYIMEKNQ